MYTINLTTTMSGASAPFIDHVVNGQIKDILLKDPTATIVRQYKDRTVTERWVGGFKEMPSAERNK